MIEKVLNLFHKSILLQVLLETLLVLVEITLYNEALMAMKLFCFVLALFFFPSSFP